MMNLPTILLVDNDIVFLENASEYFKRNGYKPICAETPEHARDIITHTQIALAVIDYRLINDDDERDRSGLTLARYMVGLSIPNIIITKFDNYKYAVESLRSEINGAAALDFVIKQDGLERLLEAVERVLLRARVFLCYATPDREKTRALYKALKTAGFIPWMDKKQIIAGENWDLAIRRAIRASDFFVACLSNNSVNRRGYVQREIRFALEIWEEKLENDIYMIPARFEECDIGHEKLKELQWVDIFMPDGFTKLTHAIRAGIHRRYQQI